MNKKIKAILICVGVIVLVAILYVVGIKYYTTRFLPNTTINGIEVAGKTEEEAIALLNVKVDEFSLQVIGRENQLFAIKSNEIDMDANWGDSVTQISAAQDKNKWIFALFSKDENLLPYVISFDDNKLKDRLNQEESISPSGMRSPVNADIGEYDAEKGQYQFLEADQGTYLQKTKMINCIKDNIKLMNEKMNLDEEECYVKPTVDNDDVRLVETYNYMNKLVSTCLTYHFGEKTEVLDGNQIHEWISRQGYIVKLDEKKAYEYVQYLAKNYDTAYRKHDFTTYDGQDIVIDKGFYGWWMNRKGESLEIIDLIKEGTVADKKPVYLQEAATYDTPDYGNTYAEINLSTQHMYFIKEGKLFLESDFVSGNVRNGNATPDGIYPITYKQRKATLKGADYETDVDYWMPFNGSVGMHDASWRDKFGGTIYQTNGSHGCINLPPEIAEQIFEEVYAGMPVICYYNTETASE